MPGRRHPASFVQCINAEVLRARGARGNQLGSPGARGRIAASCGVARCASPTANSVGRRNKMRQAQARKISDAYLHAPKRSERHLHAVEDSAIALAEPEPRVVEDLRVEAPAVEIPDWAEPFSDARW